MMRSFAILSLVVFAATLTNSEAKQHSVLRIESRELGVGEKNATLTSKSAKSGESDSESTKSTKKAAKKTKTSKKVKVQKGSKKAKESKNSDEVGEPEVEPASEDVETPEVPPEVPPEVAPEVPPEVSPEVPPEVPTPPAGGNTAPLATNPPSPDGPSSAIRASQTIAIAAALLLTAAGSLF
mmetsp:Transcript_18452/g.51467  ORF Transcript_18452/g.51467 Transcript_18452/m.51467 type:complete len:182 (+) Transcript_18452:180-725(+)